MADRVDAGGEGVVGLTSVKKLPDGSVRGFIYVSFHNAPVGHLEVQAENMDAFKALMNAAGAWIVNNDSAIIHPDGRRMLG